MNGLKADPENVKADPDLDDVPMGGFADDDEYEDTGELTMPREEQTIWLAKVPHWLHEALVARPSSDNPEEIAKFELYEPDEELPLSERQERGKITFTGNWRIPRQYDVTMTKMNPQNIHIFSEKNLPGYKPDSQYRKGDNSDKPKDDTNPSRDSGYRGDFSGGGSRGGIKKNTPRYRRAIPKQTALLRTLSREINLSPLDNAEYRAFHRRAEEAQHASKLRVIDDTSELYALSNIGTRELNVGTIIKGSAPTKRSHDNKAARIPETELVSLLFQAFKEFKYFPLKVLRQRLRQPEQYLKSVLGTIAEMNTSGHFNGTWQLKKEHQLDLDVEGAIAPGEGGEEEDDDEDEEGDEDDEEMETVA